MQVKVETEHDWQSKQAVTKQILIKFTQHQAVDSNGEGKGSRGKSLRVQGQDLEWS